MSSQDAAATAINDLPAIGVVVIGRNEGERLRRCLESVRVMNYPQPLLRLIYVDSASTDTSVALARSLGAEVIALDGPTTAARGRNAGWTRLNSPFVLFLDGDTILDPGFVRAALLPFADAAIAGVGGHRRELDPNGSIYNAVFDVDWLQQPGPKPNFGGDALVRMAALQAVGGFNDLLAGGEEPDICRRMRALGYEVLHIDAQMTWHDLAIHSFSKYWRRSVRTGYAYAEISSIYARTTDPLWIAESRHNLRRGLFWTALPGACIVASFATHSILPCVLFLAVAFVALSRTVRKVRAKGCGWKQSIAYGLHAHLQNIPILVGQIRFWLSGVRHQPNPAPAMPQPGK